eukprot:14540203-Ditylum_brightwellii.AAC.1
MAGIAAVDSVAAACSGVDTVGEVAVAVPFAPLQIGCQSQKNGIHWLSGLICQILHLFLKLTKFFCCDIAIVVKQ